MWSDRLSTVKYAQSLFRDERKFDFNFTKNPFTGHSNDQNTNTDHGDCKRWTAGEEALCPGPFTLALTCRKKKALQITLDGYTYKPMSVTSETDTQTQRTWENTPVLYAVLISLVSLSPSLSVQLTEHAGVIRLESDSKWHFTHARPCRLITQPQGCIFLVCVTPLPHTSTYTHTSAAQLHIETHKHMSQILNP